MREPEGPRGNEPTASLSDEEPADWMGARGAYRAGGRASRMPSNGAAASGDSFA